MGIFSNKILSNSLWMMIEKFLGIFGLIFINSYMAKYIGPENFGKLSFATSIFIFVQTFTWFGGQNVLFKRLSQNFESGVLLSTTTQTMRRLIFILSSFIALLYLWFSSDTLTFIFGLGNFIASYFIISDLYTIYNNSQLTSKINAITNLIGLAIALIIRFFLVFLEEEAYTMIYPIIIFSCLPYFLRKYIFSRNNNIKIKKNNRRKYEKYLFLTGGSLVLSNLSIVIYTQISNIFLAKYVSFSQLAIYNVAMTLGGAWSFITTALITSYFPKIYATLDKVMEAKYLQQIQLIVIAISVCIYLGVILLGEWVIKLLYGTDYLYSVKILPYIVVGTMLSALGTISYRYMLKFNAYKYLSIKMLVVCVFSIPISYFLIQNYEVLGAAYCFVLIELFSLTIANYFFKNGFIMKTHLGIFSLRKN